MPSDCKCYPVSCLSRAVVPFYRSRSPPGAPEVGNRFHKEQNCFIRPTFSCISLRNISNTVMYHLGFFHQHWRPPTVIFLNNKGLSNVFHPRAKAMTTDLQSLLSVDEKTQAWIDMRANGRGLFASSTNLNLFAKTEYKNKKWHYVWKAQLTRELIAVDIVIPRQGLVRYALPKSKSKYTFEEVDTFIRL